MRKLELLVFIFDGTSSVGVVRKGTVSMCLKRGVNVSVIIG